MSETPSFGAFEKGLRASNDFTRVAPKDKFAGDRNEQTSGMLHILSGKMIESIWGKMTESVEQNHGIVHELLVSSPRLTEKLQEMSIEQACCHLSTIMIHCLGRYLIVWEKDMEQLMTGDIDTLSQYINYKSTLMLGGSAIGSSKPFEHMLTGFKTGIIESWRIILESCRAHQNQMNEPINLAALEEISRNSGSLLTKLASTHMRIFMHYSLIVNSNNPSALDFSPDASLFQIEGSVPARKLGISPQLMAKIGEQYFGTDEKQYSGCPALHAKGKDHPNVIEDLHQQMVVPAALHYLKPLLAH